MLKSIVGKVTFQDCNLSTQNKITQKVTIFPRAYFTDTI